MADLDETSAGDAFGAELRGCAYCGEAILPGSYRCPGCAGNVGLAWGTAHKEHFLFLFASILIAVGCLCSWTQRFPAGATIARTTLVAPAAPLPGAPAPAPGASAPAPVEVVTQVAPTVETLAGLDTIRGSFLFAIALYGILAALFNLLYKRMTVWPFFLGSVLALEVGLKGMTSAMSSDAWEMWKTRANATGNFVEGVVGAWRAIPPAYLLFTFAGALVLISLIKGVVGGFASASAKQKEKVAASSEAAEARKKAREAKAPGSAGLPPPGPRP